MKDVLIIFGLCLIAIALGAWLLFAHPKTEERSTPPVAEAAASIPVTATSLYSGTNASTVKERKNYRVTDVDGFAKLWKLTGNAASKMPAVDFSKNHVIGVFAGTESTGGFSIAVTSVVDSATERTVFVTITKPGKNCMVTESVTSPYALVTVPVSMLPLAHEDAVETKDCAQ